MIRSIILAVFAVLFACAAPDSAHAQHCRLVPPGVVACPQGWLWRDGREWNEYEWRERHRWHEEERRERWREEQRVSEWERSIIRLGYEGGYSDAQVGRWLNRPKATVRYNRCMLGLGRTSRWRPQCGKPFIISADLN